MNSSSPQLLASQHRDPLRVLFLLTAMPVGGAETLLVELVRRLNRARFAPEIACLKQLDVLGERISRELPTSSNYISCKYDLRVLPKLVRRLKMREIDALITIGAGDKMFWGRLAAFVARTPVVISALHSTGWPDGVGKLNRALTRITDAFIAVAGEHGRYLCEEERFPLDKVHVIPNGIDTDRFHRDITAGIGVRRELAIPLDAPVCGILAALRHEKHHAMFLQGAAAIRKRIPDTRFLVVGDGPERSRLEALAQTLGLTDAVHFLGTRNDVPAILAAMNVMLLTSKMEANPVSILEALSSEVPVVATRVGSVPATVIDGETGYLVAPDDVANLAEKVTGLLCHPEHAQRMGRRGRQKIIASWSVDRMVQGYEDLITEIYDGKALRPGVSAALTPRVAPNDRTSLCAKT